MDRWELLSVAGFFAALLVPIMCAIALSGKRWREEQERARERRIAEARLNARLLRLIFNLCALNPRHVGSRHDDARRAPHAAESRGRRPSVRNRPDRAADREVLTGVFQSPALFQKDLADW